jgi:rhodanese-related sulfurtransferase
MNMLKSAIFQAVAVIAIGAAVAFVYNANSVNGIDPFRRVADVPVIGDSLSAGAVVEDAEGIRFISLGETQDALERGWYLLDARTAAEFAEGHIPGAILFDYYELGWYVENVLPSIPADQEIVVYCAGPECEDSELLARELYLLGYTHVSVFKGGIAEWEGQRLPIESGQYR